MSWRPSSWRRRPAAQQPHYPDPLALRAVESCLAAAAPIAMPSDSARLKACLGEVAEGRAFLLQGGDCAESFAEFSADKVRRTHDLLAELAALIEDDGGCETVKVGRIAGQFAKPRSADMETIGGLSCPIYRGDIVNGLKFDPAIRTPDPVRMLEAYRQSQATVGLLEQLAFSAFAEGSDIHRRARAHIGLPLPRPAPAGERESRLFTSHEALLLPYEQALTRFDEESQAWWSVSAHMLWIGERTRELDGAHVEFARGIANPIGIKCGPALKPDELLGLIDRLDPGNAPGRLVLIGRFGADDIDRCLPPLMRATRRAGRRVIWSCDPCHGNTRLACGRKTRLVGDMLAEIRTFFRVARSEGVHPGGAHLELTGNAVTECLDSGPPEGDALGKAYLTHCDPRLNARQSRLVVSQIARQLAGGRSLRSRAA